MDTQYDNTNRGVLFPNKKTNENQPDFTGTINVNGEELRLAAWKKKSKSGDMTFLSITVSEDTQIG